MKQSKLIEIKTLASELQLVRHNDLYRPNYPRMLTYLNDGYVNDRGNREESKVGSEQHSEQQGLWIDIPTNKRLVP